MQIRFLVYAEPGYADIMTKRNMQMAIVARNFDKPKLLDQVRGKMRALHFSKRTEEAYVGWIQRCPDTSRSGNDAQKVAGGTDTDPWRIDVWIRTEIDGSVSATNKRYRL